MRMLSLALLLCAAPAVGQEAMPAGAPAKPPAAPIIDPRAAVDGLPIAALPPQALPAKGCAAFLWTRTPSMAPVAMATTDPAMLRLSIDGKTRDLPISAQNGIGGLGFSQVTEYKDAGVTATLQGTVKTDAGAPKSGSISDASLRIDRAGRNSFTIPVGGAITCA